MQVSTKIFNKQSVDTFSDLAAQIQKKQEQVASGKHLTKPSDDPVKAARVNTVKEQKAQAEQFIRNIDISSVKLSLSDSALEEAANLVTRIYELGIQGRSDTNASGRDSLIIEMEGLLDGCAAWQTLQMLLDVQFLEALELAIHLLRSTQPMKLILLATGACTKSRFPIRWSCRHLSMVQACLSEFRRRMEAASLHFGRRNDIQSGFR